MKIAVNRGSQAAQQARLGRRAPLSRRQGALLASLIEQRKVRPVDTIADARKAAKGTAA